MGKGLDTFVILSQPWSQCSTYTGLFLTFPTAHLFQVFLIIFHDRRTLTI